MNLHRGNKYQTINRLLCTHGLPPAFLLVAAALLICSDWVRRAC